MTVVWGNGEARWWAYSRKKGWLLVKPWYQSKTVWTNIIGAVVYLLNGDVGRLLPAPYVGMALAAMNIILRFATDEPIRLLR